MGTEFWSPPNTKADTRPAHGRHLFEKQVETSADVASCRSQVEAAGFGTVVGCCRCSEAANARDLRLLIMLYMYILWSIYTYIYRCPRTHAVLLISFFLSFFFPLFFPIYILKTQKEEKHCCFFLVLGEALVKKLVLEIIGIYNAG